MLIDKKLGEIPQENLFLELYSKAHVRAICEFSYGTERFLLVLLVLGLPYIWRAIRGREQFENNYQLAVEMVMIMPKFIFYTSNF